MGDNTMHQVSCQFSLVIPAFNEEESVEPLYQEIVRTVDEHFDDYEIIFVDDCSFDDTSSRIEEVRARDHRVRNIRLPQNRGKSAGYSAGFAAAKGKLIATMDADLQDDILDLPKMLLEIESGHDLVIGWKTGRFKNEPLKAFPSMVFNFLLFLVFGIRIHDSNCGFRVMKRAVAKTLNLYGGFYRFIPELAHSKGFRVTEVPIHHRARKFGASKFGPGRFWTGILDIITVRFVTAFIDSPLHFFGTLAMLIFLAGAGIETYALVGKLSGETFQEHVAAIVIGAMLILVSVQVLTTGLIGEMITARLDRQTAHNSEELGMQPPARDRLDRAE